jgi:hypothetical protein
MARFVGRRGQLEVALTVATPTVFTTIPFVAKFSVNNDVPQLECTAMGDTNEINLAGIPKSGGTYSGFMDSASVQLLNVALDGVPRPFKFTEDTSAGTPRIWSGSATFSYNADFDAKGVVTVSGNWSAAAAVTRA